MSDHFNNDLLKQFVDDRIKHVQAKTSLIQFDIWNILILKILKQIVKKIDQLLMFEV